MAITLIQIPQPLPTPIGFNSDSAQKFAKLYYTLAEPSINLKEKRTIRILALLYQLAARTSVNYKSNHKGLIQDAITYLGAISIPDMEIAMAATDYSAGSKVASDLSTEVRTLLQEGRDFLELPLEQQDRCIAYLRSQLGT